VGFFKRVRKAVAKVDPTRLPVVGKYIAQAAATSAVVVTGGAVLLAKPDMTKTAMQGFATGAAVGGAIAGGSILTSAQKKTSATDAVAAGVSQVKTASVAAAPPPAPLPVVPPPEAPAAPASGTGVVVGVGVLLLLLLLVATGRRK
jgi:hypothetical protein